MVPGVNPERRIVVHNNSLENMIKAATERVLFLNMGGTLVECPRPSSILVKNRLGLFKQRLLTRLTSTTPVSLEEFPLQYTGRKRLVYSAAVESLYHFPLVRGDAQVSWFVKREKVDGTDKDDLVPRMISPRSARYNVVIGRYLKHTEKLLFRGIARVWGETVVSKGLNSSQTASLIAEKWGSYCDPVAVGLDAKRFDQHVSLEVLQHFEHAVFNGWFKSREFARAISWQLRNVCRGYTPDGVLKAEFDGKRMSGDMNTSSGNCLIMCAMIWTYCRHRGVTASLINNGDDCVVFMNRSHLPMFMKDLDKWFLELGFRMTIERPVFEIEKVEFCQAHPIAVDKGYVMVRNLEASLSKDSVCLVQVNHRDSVAAWLGAVGAAGTAMCGGIPVLDSFYQAYERNGIIVPKWSKHYETTGMSYLAEGMNRRGLPILSKTRLSYYIAFGVLPDEQLLIERYFDKLSIPRSMPVIPDDRFPDDQPPPYAQLVSFATQSKLNC